MKKIDTHCHLFTQEYVDELNKRSLFNIRTRPPVWTSAEARIADMDKLGIERQVLSLSNPLVYFPDDGLNLHLAQMINDFLAEVCHKHPDRFSGFVAVPLGNVKHATDELKRALKAPGMLGVVVGTHVRGKILASPEFLPFFEEVNRLGVPIFIHPVSPLGIEKVQEYQDLHRSVGFLWETTMTVGRLALSGVFEKYQNIDWILSHLGGTIPFVYTSLDMCQKRNPAKEYVPPKPASEYLRRLYVDAARHLTMPILACALDLYGEDHIMFGSDIPFAYDVASQNVPALESFNISDQLKQRICYQNAQRLLKL